MNAFLCILYELVEQFVEHVLLVDVVRVGFHHPRGSSSGTKIGIVYMTVGVDTLEGVGLGKEVALIDGGNALCKGGMGGDVGLGVEGFALNGPRQRVVARSWRVIQ